MKAFTVLTLACSGICLASCVAPVGSELRVPEDAANICQSHCHSIGLTLSAVAIMANNVGCICQAAPHGSSAVGSREAITGGMATIMLQEEERRRQERQQSGTL